MDYGHQWTDKELKKLEKHIAKEYKQAAKEMQGKLNDYMQKFAVKDRKKLAQVQAGEITQSEYERWRTGQIAIGERWEEMKDTLAEDMLTTNKKVDSMARQFSYDAYALNHNYGTFEAEKGSHVDTSYTLYDRNTVERLVRDNPDLLPPPGKKVSQDIKDGKLKKWNKQKIQSVMTQSILQGETIPQIAKRLATAVGDSNMKSAIRNARTMTTGAENAGRVDSYKRAVGMGIQMEQIWLATLDGRTRHEHRQLDGQKIKVGEKFSVDGYEIAFPGDPTAEAFLVYNCRCTLIGKVAGSDLDPLDMSQRNTDRMGMEYEEWKNAKAKKQEEPQKNDSLADIKDFNGLKDYFKNQYNINIADSVKDLDLGHVKQSLGGVDALIKDFPVLKKQIKDIKSGRSSGYMFSHGNDVCMTDSDFKKGKSFNSDEAFQSGAHEAGHCLDMILCQMNTRPNDVFGSGNWLAHSEWMSCTQSRKVISSAISALKKKYPEYKNYNAKNIRYFLSSYALTDTSESLAEGVGYYTLYKNRGYDVTNSSQVARFRFSEEIVNVIRNKLGGLS